MNIWSRNLLLATQQAGKQTRVYASEEALQAALDIGSAIKINDGMGEDPYRYTAYPFSTTKSGNFTYTSRINKIKTNNNETFYYASFNVPTNAVEIQSDISDSIITTFGDQDNANVTINVDQNQNGAAYKNSNEQIIYIGEDNKVYNNLKQYILPQPSKEFVTDGVEINNVFYARTSASDVTDLPVAINSTTDVETKTSVIRNQQLLECDSLTGYDLVKIENDGQLYSTNQQHLINNDSVTSLLLKYNNKTVYYQQQIANRNCFRKAHNVTVNPIKAVIVEDITNFTTSNYVATLSNFDFSNYSNWEFILHIKTPSTLVTGDYPKGLVTCTVGESAKCGFDIYLNQWGLGINGSSNSSTWILGTVLTGITASTEYWFKLKYTGTQYEYYLADNPEFTNAQTAVDSISTKLNSSTNNVIFGKFLRTTANFLTFEDGIIYMKDCTFTADGNVVFDGSKMQYSIIGTPTITTYKEPLEDTTIKLYNETSSTGTIQGWNGQKIDYEVSKTGYDTLTGSYTIPMDKDNRAYTLDVSMEEEIILPTGYTRLQYIETNNGNSWVNTGITTNPSDIYDVTFSVNSLPSYTSSTPGYMAVFGSGDADVDFFYTAFSGWNKWQLVWGQRTIDATQVTAINTWYHLTAKNGVLTVNGKDISFNQSTPSTSLTMYIGRMHHQQSSLTMYFNGKLKKFTITRAGSLFRQYVPAKYDLGGGSYSVGYYDTVTDTFLTSIGTYPFLAGPDYY